MKSQNLKGIIPDSVLAQIDENFIQTFNCNTDLRLAHFLAQCSHESGGFKAVTENLNYSADGLLKIFPKYFDATTAPQYARQPEKIANRVYAGRMGNGVEASGEGFKFRGRGYIQLTGKDNYTAFDKTVADDVLLAPDLVATKYPLASAAFFFNKNNLWAICDKGYGSDTILAVTKKVNGGTIGLEHRTSEFVKIWNELKK